MDSNTRRTLLALGLSMLLMVAWSAYLRRRYPPPPPPPPAAMTSPKTPSSQPAGSAGLAAASAPTVPPPAAALASATRGDAAIATAAEPATYELGRDEPAGLGEPDKFWLYVRLSSRGAAITAADLTPYRNTVARSADSPPDTYDLLRPVSDPRTGAAHLPFATAAARLIDLKEEVDLSALDWSGRKEIGRDAQGRTYERVVFSTRIARGGEPLVEVRKTYALSPGRFDLGLRLEVENLSSRPLAVSLRQDGALGMRHEQVQRDDHWVLTAQGAGDALTIHPYQRTKLLHTADRRVEFRPDASTPLRWMAFVNKWFVCAVAPAAPGDAAALTPVEAQVFTRSDDDAAVDDVAGAIVLRPGEPLPPRTTAAVELEVYAGPKDRRRFMNDPAYAAKEYERIVDVTGTSCAFLTFQFLNRAMGWLLRTLHAVMPGRHNYGWAIIVMVLIVRVALHGVTKRAQINTMRMQKRMASLQPKMEALRQKYSGDAATLNREMMNLYRTEGVNPLGQMWSCLPMFLQMPIWIALWTTLNTTIELRHEPFILWIRDLAAPDELIRFSRAYHIPLIGAMMGPLSALNVLPIVMGVTMYLQQKLTQRLTRPDVPLSEESPGDGRPSPAAQMRQQQKIMSFMTVFFALMFYNFPCGLNLYIFTSNLFGMLEQYQIRRHISAADLDARAAAAVATPRRVTYFTRLLQRWAELQKKADEARLAQRSGSSRRRRH